MDNSSHHYNKTIHICNWFYHHWIHNTILHIKSLEPVWHWDLCKNNLIEFGWYDFTSSDPHVSWLLHSFMILWLFTPLNKQWNIVPYFHAFNACHTVCEAAITKLLLTAAWQNQHFTFNIVKICYNFFQ